MLSKMDMQVLGDIIRSHCLPSLHSPLLLFLVNVYPKPHPNSDARMTPTCMQRSVLTGSHTGLGD